MSSPAQSELVIRGAQVVSMDPNIGDLPRGDIHIRDGQIVAVGSDLTVDGVTGIAGGGLIAIPGLVDTHWHLWNSIFRIALGDGGVRGYFMMKEKLGPHYRPEDTYRAVRFSLLEALSAGVTTVHDWAHNYLGPDDADAILEAHASIPLRARYSPGAPSTTPGLPLAQMAPIMERYGHPVDKPMDYAGVERLIGTVAGAADALVTLGVNLRGPLRSPREVYVEEWAFARAHDLPISMHCGGSQKEVALLREVEVLEADGLLGPDVLLCHGGQWTDGEIATIGARGVSVAISPVGELMSGWGVARIRELHELGVSVGLSFDTTGFGAANMFAVMQAAVNAENSRLADGAGLTVQRALEMATIEGARVLKLDDRIGSITPGKRADIVLIRSTDLNTALFGDPAMALVFACHPGNVETVIVDGRVLKRDGELVGVDPAKVVQDASDAYADLVVRAG